MPDLSQIMLQAQQMQEDMAAAQASLADAEVTGTAGGGLVSAVVNGEGRLQAVVIDPSVVDPDDVETLGDLVVAAVRDAERRAGELAARTMGAVTDQMAGLAGGLGLGGLGFGGPGAPGVIDAGPDKV
nr:YbaB/EbfC family nucleoid-associated protein [Nakamurella alba]